METIGIVGAHKLGTVLARTSASAGHRAQRSAGRPRVRSGHLGSTVVQVPQRVRGWEIAINAMNCWP
jgi:hypothetical protein